MTFTAFPTQGNLRISGYASLFGHVDMSGDIVHKGAFSASLLARGSVKIPMLYGHETQAPIGIWDRVFEDGSGLFVSGRIVLGSSQSDRTAQLVIEEAVSGLSIGYQVRRASPRSTPIGRNLLELDLYEISIVAFPMLSSARITQVETFSPPFNPTQFQQGV